MGQILILPFFFDAPSAEFDALSPEFDAFCLKRDFL